LRWQQLLLLLAMHLRWKMLLAKLRLLRWLLLAHGKKMKPRGRSLLWVDRGQGGWGQGDRGVGRRANST
jgi:hypothetical protein